MSVVKLNDYLSENKDAIRDLLEGLGCENIKYNGAKNEFRCSREYGKNPTAVWVDVSSLKYSCFSTSEYGSIYNFIMSKKNCSFPDSLRWVAKTLGLDKNIYDNSEIKVPFGGYYKQLIRSQIEPETEMRVYNQSILDSYGRNPNLSFLKDGIALNVQEEFDLGYDIETDRITIPQWNFNGDLVGIMGRSNDPDIPYEFRWLPIIPCSRSYTLYGYHQNYRQIQQTQTCVITESEKGVMQLASMGFRNGLATCTKSISKVQEKYIKALRVDKIILAYDQGVSEEQLRYEAEKLVIDNPIYKNKVGYIFDGSGDILGLNTKMSPTDVGIKGYKELINNYARYI